MPRLIHTIISKNNPNEKHALNALSYQEALEEALVKLGWSAVSDLNPMHDLMHEETTEETLEEALDKLGWTMTANWDHPYDLMFQDEHIMSLKSQGLI